MRPFIFTFSLLILLTNVIYPGEEAEFGIVFGGKLSRPSGTLMHSNWENEGSPEIGLTMGYGTSRVKFNTGVSFTTLKGHAEFEDYNPFQGILSYEGDLNFHALSVPLLVHFRLLGYQRSVVGPYFEVGPNLVILTAAKAAMHVEAQNGEEDSRTFYLLRDMNNVTLAAVARTGFNITLRKATISFFLQYKQGLWSLIQKDLREDSLFWLLSNGGSNPAYVMRTFNVGVMVQLAYGRESK